ncbi:hypothetical protein K438DRAFT_1945619 [Mycena galopus ATCC 62051]|nr:hypothetical protein K438DRAFT_1945619 [Mycena galopus ATCC 62051]
MNKNEQTKSLDMTYAEIEPALGPMGRRVGDWASLRAGPSAAIRLKQLEVKTGNEVRVTMLEKRSEIGARIFSGAVIERSALDALFPDWHSRYPDLPLAQLVTSSGVRLLTEEYSIPISHPSQMNSKGNYIASLSHIAAWLGGIAEELGVEVYPNFAAAQFLLSPLGIVTVPVQDGGTDGRTDNRPVPSLGCWSSQHAVPSPDGSKDGRPVHRKTEDGRMILVTRNESAAAADSAQGNSA